MVRTEGRSVLHLSTKFVADSLIRSKVIRGSQNFEIGSRDSGHAHLWFIRSSGPSSMPVKRFSAENFLTPVKNGPKNGGFSGIRGFKCYIFVF